MGFNGRSRSRRQNTTCQRWHKLRGLSGASPINKHHIKPLRQLQRVKVSCQCLDLISIKHQQFSLVSDLDDAAILKTENVRRLGSHFLHRLSQREHLALDHIFFDAFCECTMLTGMKADRPAI